MCDTVRLR